MKNPSHILRKRLNLIITEEEIKILKGPAGFLFAVSMAMLFVFFLALGEWVANLFLS